MTQSDPDLSTRYPTVRFADALDELRREAAARRRTYPDWIARGRMTQAEADYQLAILDAIAADVTRRARWAGTGTRLPPAEHSFTWHQRREAIAREMDQRTRLYPDWIAKGRLDQAEAARRIECLRAVADLFDDGHDWHARNGLRIFLGHDPATAAEAEAQAEFWQHYTTVMQARGLMPPAQEALAL